MKKNIITLIAICLYCNFASSAEIEKLVILGSGPAGLTSSLFAAQAHLEPLVIEGDPYEGQISAIYRIENYPGFPEGISGKELAERIHMQAEMFGTRFHSSSVIDVDLMQYPFRILLGDGLEIYCESLVIATGASPKWLGLEGEAALIGHGISASATLDAAKFRDQDVVVVGGGDSAMEQAILLTEYANHVTIIHKDDKLSGASYLQERIFKNTKIDCKFNSEIAAIEGVNEGHVTGLILRNVKTKEENPFACTGIFVSNGRKPNTDLFLNQLEMTDKGFIKTKPDSTLTSVPGVFAAGDITHVAYRKVTTAAASGCMSAIDVTKFFADQRKKK